MRPVEAVLRGFVTPEATLWWTRMYETAIAPRLAHIVELNRGDQIPVLVYALDMHLSPMYLGWRWSGANPDVFAMPVKVRRDLSVPNPRFPFLAPFVSRKFDDKRPTLRLYIATGPGFLTPEVGADARYAFRERPVIDAPTLERPATDDPRADPAADSQKTE
ncbi:MAG: hypothetical protein ABSC94_05600 [Polyangiaceae bacterium]|jgi:hypothetical protein